MKKKKIILSVFGATILAGALVSTPIIINNLSNNNEVRLGENLINNESTLSEDDALSLGIKSIEAGEIKLTSDTEEEIVSPVIGYQTYYDSENSKLSIRYFAAITSLSNTVTWTRALYNSDGTINEGLPMGNVVSQVAYTSLSYYDGSDVKVLNAEDVEAPDSSKPYKYFAIYTLKDISSTYQNCNLVVKATISNSINSVESKAGSVETKNNGAYASIEGNIYLSKTVKIDNSYNGTYEYKTIKTIYSKTDAVLDISCACIPLSNASISSSGFTAGELGKQTITLTSGDLETTYDIYVLNISNPIESSVKATVDGSYSGTIGDYDSTLGYQFKTITQALEFLQNINLVSASAAKTLDIKAGTYNEKIEINTPNLTITGQGASTTKIEYNSLYGQLEGNGFMNKTDSTQTVAIRESATNCHISNITISNYYNTIESYADTNYAGKGERGLALLCQADQVVIENSSFLGWQDTLELFTGRQYFKNCYISGCIDYIFGTNNTTYFDQCEIHTVKGKTNASSENVNAYVTAFKGTNHDDGRDKIAYGAIFNDCDFTSDSGFVGEYAIARPWTKYSNVAILNSTFDSNVATTLSRTVALGLIKTYAENALNIKLYNNTGLSVTDDLDGVINTSLTSSDAANYVDYSVIYGKTNGYTIGWHPVNGLDTDNNVYYWFHGTAPTTGTLYEVDSQYYGKDSNFTLGDISFNNCRRRTEQNGDLYVGGSVEITVPGKTLITINSYPGYHTYKIGDTYANSDTVYYYVDSESPTTITLEKAGGGFYLYSIILNSFETLDTPVLEGLILSGTPTSAYAVGDDYDLSNLVVKAAYDNGVYYILDSSDYTVDTTDVDKTQEGTYTVTVTYNDGTTTKTKDFEIEYVAAVETRITETTGFTFKGTSYTGTNVKNLNDGTHNNEIASGTIEKVTFNTGGSNGLNNWLHFNNGNTISFETSDVCLLNICFYQGTNNATVTLNGKTVNLKSSTGSGDQCKYSYELKQAGNVVITGSGSSHYIGYFEVVFGVTFDEDPEVIDSNSTLVLGTDNTALAAKLSGGTTLEGSKLVFNNYTLDATNGKLRLNASNNAQLNNGTKISFTVAANATVNIDAYNSSTAYTLNGVAKTGDSSITVSEETDIEIVVTADCYFQGIEITYPTYIDENDIIHFGTAGDYSSKVSVTGSTRDAATDETQFYSGATISFNVKEGAIVYIYGHSGYTSYNVTINGVTSSTITDIGYSTTATSDTEVVITSTDNNNYLYYVQITYPLEDTNITFGSTGNFAAFKNSGQVTFAGDYSSNSGENYAQVKSGTMSFLVKEGETVTIQGNYSVDYEITINGETTLVQGQTSDVITKSFVALTTQTVSIVCQTGSNDYSKGNYFEYIDIA